MEASSAADGEIFVQVGDRIAIGGQAQLTGVRTGLFLASANLVCGMLPSPLVLCHLCHLIVY
jgi:hypothetical protein